MKKIKLGFFIALMLFAIPKTYAQLGDFGGAMTAIAAPPPMPAYDQPLCPSDGNQWQPGYWAYDSALSDFYFVPGTWVIAPQPGLLWTPPYWGYENGLYGFHPGYWGTDVGFYGGIDYGFGYFGLGFSGGKWKGHHFHYNTAVTHVNTKVVHDTYVDNTVIVNNNVNVSFNGPGGIRVKPRPEEIRVMNETHIQPTQAQIEYQRSASVDHNQFAKNNYGRPTTTAVNRANSYHPQASVPHTNGHASSSASRTSSTGRRQGSTANSSSHTRSSSGGQQHHSSQNRSQTSRQHTSQQHTSQQRTSQQHTSQQRTSQQHTSQQRTSQTRVQQTHLPQQTHVQQPRVQQPRPTVQPRKATH